VVAPVTVPRAPPTRVVTPPGGASRLALGDAVVTVGEDAELSVDTAADGTITVQLARGLVDCEVEPRPGRAPFRVIAGDVTVTVVGTRFSVEKSAAGVRVGVTRGKVQVASSTGTVQVAAGQEWEPARGVVASAPAVLPTPPRAPPAPPPLDAPPAQALAEAQRVEVKDPDGAAALYKQIAAAPGDPAAAELAAFQLARLEFRRSRWDAALAAARGYEQAFPHGEHLEAVLWFRVEASCGAYRSRAAEAAARAYLARFPEGKHAVRARSRAVCVR
jgi:hypothetical protein